MPSTTSTFSVSVPLDVRDVLTELRFRLAESLKFAARNEGEPSVYWDGRAASYQQAISLLEPLDAR